MPPNEGQMAASIGHNEAGSQPRDQESVQKNAVTIREEANSGLGEERSTQEISPPKFERNVSSSSNMMIHLNDDNSEWPPC